MDKEMELAWLRVRIIGGVRAIDPHAKAVMFAHLGRVTTFDVRTTQSTLDRSYNVFIQQPNGVVWRSTMGSGSSELEALTNLDSTIQGAIHLRDKPNGLREFTRSVVEYVVEDCNRSGMTELCKHLHSGSTLEVAQGCYAALVNFGRRMSSGDYGSLD